MTFDSRSSWRRVGRGLLIWLPLLLLAAYTILYLNSGWKASHSHLQADMLTRVREYDVFRQGLYPIRSLVPHPVPGSFPFSVYPPYALPMFALFFGVGGAAQGWFTIHALSLLSLALLAWIGWRSLRFAGPAAATLGALAPVAISGNSYSLYQGQFSILCMGLISLQWLLLERRRPLAAGLCWAAAMLKPQIALAFVLPLLGRRQRRGLALGIGLLLALTAGALAYTRVSPLQYLRVWLVPERLDFVQAGTLNLMRLGAPALALLVAIAAMALGFCLLSGRWLPRTGGLLTSSPAPLHRYALESHGLSRSLRLQGLCGVLGCLAFYHHPYDNIMLYPALLAILALALRRPTVWKRLVAASMAASLWFPVHLTANNLRAQSLMAVITLVVGLTLLRNGPECLPTAKPTPFQVS